MLEQSVVSGIVTSCSWRLEMLEDEKPESSEVRDMERGEEERLRSSDSVSSSQSRVAVLKSSFLKTAS